MVSPNPTSAGDGGGDRSSQQQQQQNPKEAPLAVHRLGSLPVAAAGPSSSEDTSKKIRKPYTITKSRESWTDQEHDKFLEALQLFDRDWKKIEAFVGSKTVIQIRSHAQKYFLKVQKNGTSEHVPPPRPKRKAAHPYPQKASKNAAAVPPPPPPQASVPQYQASSSQGEPMYAVRTDPPSVLNNFNSGAAKLPWTQGSATAMNPQSVTREDVMVGGGAMVNNCSSSTESPTRTWTAAESSDQGAFTPSHRVMPDFAKVYSFIGSVFDPNISGHLEKLKEMDPIDVETVLLLMRNLSVNLTSPEFENHFFPSNSVSSSSEKRRLLSSYDISKEDVRLSGANDPSQMNQSTNAPFIVKNG